MTNRWQLYQHERFPILTYAPLIAALSFSAVSVSAFLRGQGVPPEARGLLVAFISVFLFFLQLRIADEFKDYEDDARFRPYRPVPRGLVTLPELGRLGAAATVIQLALALWVKPALALLLILVWAYLGLMWKEFFVPRWLKAHPVTYLWSHMLIMPLIALYASACEWLPGGSMPARGLAWFLMVSFFNGIVIEIGRKIRTPEDEEPGVETYSVLWGRRNAVLTWLGAMLLAATGAWVSADRIGLAGPILGSLAVLMIIALCIAWCFLHRPSTKQAKRIEHMSGLWTLLIYLGLAVAPFV